MMISACVITKNEEENLPSWLDCMKRIADEMVVVDTGSGDRTAEIARAAGAKVFFFPWIDDFAAAKNYALDRASGDWILFLDADEYFLGRDCPKLREIIRKYDENEDIQGLFFPLVNIEKATGQDLGMTGGVIRCFRRKESLRYVGRIHEELRNLSEGPRKKIQQIEDIAVYHTGYSMVLMPEKFQRTIKLLQKSQEEDGPRPTDDAYFMDCYYGLRDYENAIAYARRAIRGGDSLLGMENRPYTILIHSLMEAKHPPEEIRAALEEAVGRYPRLPEYSWLWGLLDWECRDYQAAENHFRKGMDLLESEQTKDFRVTDHSGAFLFAIYFKLGQLFYWKHQAHASIEYVKKSLEMNRGQQEALKLFCHLMGKISVGEMVRCLDELYASREDSLFLMNVLKDMHLSGSLFYYANKAGMEMDPFEQCILNEDWYQAAAMLESEAAASI